MADDVPAVADAYANMQVGSGSSDDSDVPYGPPNPFEASPDQPGSYGPPKDVFTGGGSGTSTGPSLGSLDLPGLVKAAGDAAGNVVKGVGSLTTPPQPRIPTPPSPPNLPSSLPPLPAAPPNQGPGAGQPASPAPTAPASAGNSSLTAARPKLSTGAKVAIGLGVGGIVVGGGLLIASAGRKRKS